MRFPRAIALTAGAVLIVACSGGASRLSREEFLKQGNVICARLNAIGVGSSGTGTVPDAAALQKFVNETLVPPTEKGLDELDGLRPPEELQAPTDALIAHARQVLANLQKQASTAPESLLNDFNPFAEVDKEAVALGLTECN